MYIYIYTFTYIFSNEGQRACHHSLHTNHWHCLWKIPSIIAVKSNVTTFTQVLRFVVNMFFHCGRVAFTVVIRAHIKGVRQGLASTASLDARRAL